MIEKAKRTVLRLLGFGCWTCYRRLCRYKRWFGVCTCYSPPETEDRR